MNSAFTLTMICSLLLLLGVAAWYLLAAPSSQVLCDAITHGPREDHIIALTFDDGPGPDTAHILNILRNEQVRATFFLGGANAEKAPELVQRMAAEGHCIGNHAYSHQRFLGRSPEWMTREITSTTAAVDSVRSDRVAGADFGPTRLFRPPYGLRWFGLAAVLNRLGMKMIMWDVNSEDWKRTPDQIVARVLKLSRPGSIVLLHDGMPPTESGNRGNTALALPGIIRGLSKNYRLVTIPEMLQSMEK